MQSTKCSREMSLNFIVPGCRQKKWVATLVMNPTAVGKAYMTADSFYFPTTRVHFWTLYWESIMGPGRHQLLPEKVSIAGQHCLSGLSVVGDVERRSLPNDLQEPNQNKHQHTNIHAMSSLIGELVSGFSRRRVPVDMRCSRLPS
jgi:hypothetical protein